VGGPTSDGLHLDREGSIHRVDARSKLVGAVAFVFAVVATPREQWWAFAADGALLLGIAIIGSIPLLTLARRLAIETPFIVFAFFLPFVGRDPSVAVMGVALSTAGLWAAWAIIAKGTLGACAMVLLASTTTVPDLLSALDRLRVPRMITSIAGFMARYATVVGDDLHRLSVARVSRGDRPRWFWQAKAIGATAGALFVRSYERGERVFLAMQSRGYSGSMPGFVQQRHPSRWLPCLVPAGLAATFAATAWWQR
jgi:cobalt/nickel transport system permease protein